MAIYKALFTGSFGSEKIQTVWWFKDLTGGGTGNPALDLANEVISHYNTNLKFIYHTSYLFASVQVSQMDALSGPTALQGFASGAKGALAGTEYPPMVCVCWSWQTGLSDPTRRGHIFHSGIYSGDAINGALNSSGQSRHATRVTNLMAAYGPSGSSARWRIGVWSKKRAGATLPHPASAWQQITGVFVNPVLTHHNLRRPKINTSL